jgi:hypothetical protein
MRWKRPLDGGLGFAVADAISGCDDVGVWGAGVAADAWATGATLGGGRTVATGGAVVLAGPGGAAAGVGSLLEGAGGAAGGFSPL